jgi:predicted DNA-binding ribbon-helix-helix protein
LPRVRTQVYLEERQYERLREEAFKQRLSLSELLRRIIEQAFFGERGGAPLDRSRLREKALGFVGKGHDPKPDVARNHDRYLASIGQ